MSGYKGGRQREVGRERGRVCVSDREREGGGGGGERGRQAEKGNKPLCDPYQKPRANSPPSVCCVCVCVR